MRPLWMALWMVLLGGCIPYSDHPLTEPKAECLDTAILGTWFVHEDDETVFLHMGGDSKTGGVRVVMVEFNKDREVKTSELSGHTSRLGDKTYLNLRWARPGDENAGYLFVKYDVSERGLGISLIRTDAVQKAIEKGHLKGNISRGPWTLSVRLTEPSKSLRAYVEKHDNTLFEEMKYLERLDIPIPQRSVEETSLGPVTETQGKGLRCCLFFGGRFISVEGTMIDEIERQRPAGVFQRLTRNHAGKSPIC